MYFRFDYRSLDCIPCQEALAHFDIDVGPATVINIDYMLVIFVVTEQHLKNNLVYIVLRGERNVR